MLIYEKGDLLTSDCDVIMHQANCQKVMGAGIAASIADKFPSAALVDFNDTRTPEERLGNYTLGIGSKVVVNLYGQLNMGPGLQTDYDALNSAIRKFFTDNGDYIKELKVGVPYMMGCGLAGGDWKIVEDMLVQISKDFEKDIYVYVLDE